MIYCLNCGHKKDHHSFRQDTALSWCVFRLTTGVDCPCDHLIAAEISEIGKYERMRVEAMLALASDCERMRTALEMIDNAVITMTQISDTEKLSGLEKLSSLVTFGLHGKL